MKSIFSAAFALLFTVQFSAAQQAPQASAKPAPAQAPQTLTALELFVQGITAKQQGNYVQAEAIFKALLSAIPTHLATRRALIDTLILQGKTAAAEHHLNVLYKIDPDPVWRDRYAKALGDLLAENPFRASGVFSLLPSTNANHGTQAENFGVFIIDPSGRQKSGIGMRVGANTSYGWPVGLGKRLSLHSNLTATLYKERALRHLDGQIGLSYIAQTPTDLLRFGPYVRGSKHPKPPSGDISDMAAYGLTFAYQTQLSGRDTFSFDSRWERQDFAEKTYLSGNYASANVTLGHQVTPKTNLFLSLGTSAYSPRARHQAYRGINIVLGTKNRWDNGLQTTLSVGVGKQGFDGDFPLLGAPRNDIYNTIGVSFQHPKLVIFKNIPQFGCTYRDNRSNVAFYDYDALDCQISMSRQF